MQFPKKRVSDMLKKRDDGPIHLTQEGLKKLEDRLANFKKILPELIAETQRTAAFGDRSENAAYHAAKGSLRNANFQILNIQEQLKRVVVIKEGSNTAGTVQLGSTVVLKTEGQTHSTSSFDKTQDKSGQVTFQIVGPRETDPAHGRISDQSPLGAALINHKKGAVITIQTPSGSKKYTIVEVK